MKLRRWVLASDPHTHSCRTKCFQNVTSESQNFVSENSQMHFHPSKMKLQQRPFFFQWHTYTHMDSLFDFIANRILLVMLLRWVHVIRHNLYNLLLAEYGRSFLTLFKVNEHSFQILEYFHHNSFILHCLKFSVCFHITFFFPPLIEWASIFKRYVLHLFTLIRHCPESRWEK